MLNISSVFSYQLENSCKEKKQNQSQVNLSQSTLVKKKKKYLYK